MQVIFEHLAVMKTESGIQIYVYLDRKCLNYGQDWEVGFLRGLFNAKVIALVISSKVSGKLLLLMYILTFIRHYWGLQIEPLLRRTTFL